MDNIKKHSAGRFFRVDFLAAFFFVLFLFTYSLNAVAGGGGGACTLGGTPAAATALTCGTIFAGDIGACAPPPSCDCRATCMTQRPSGSYNCIDCNKTKGSGCEAAGYCGPCNGWCFGNSVLDMCDKAVNSCGSTAISSDGLCMASIAMSGSCDFISGISKGNSSASLENPGFAQFCYPAGLLGGPCGFTYNLASISCSGGNSKLQWSLVGTCSAATFVERANACQINGSTGSTTSSSNNFSMSSGQCVIMAYDGDCGASCTFTAEIVPNFTPAVSITTPAAACVGTCFNISFTGTCWTGVNWSCASCSPSSGSSTSSPITVCPCSSGTIPVTITPVAAVGACNVTGSPTVVNLTVNPVVATITGTLTPGGGCNTTLSGVSSTCESTYSWLWSDAVSGTASTSTNCGTANASKTVTLTVASAKAGTCATAATASTTATVTWGSTCACANCTCLLPIELAEFKGESQTDNKIRLVWTTASENNNHYFVVERSQDAFIFDSIGQVNGAGNSVEMRSYEFTDKSPAYNINYYRLRQVDFSRKFSHSHVIAVSPKGEEVFRFTDIRPVPAKEKVYISYYVEEEGLLNMEIFDLNGKKAGEETLFSKKGVHTHILDLSSYSSGIYFIMLKKNDGQQTIASKFVKN